MTVNVVVIDDTDHVRKMLVEMLELDGFNVVGNSATGFDAVALALQHRPDVIVMDYAMPRMNGLEASKAVIAAIPEQNIIIYSAYVDEKLETEARKVGVAYCVGKVEGLAILERSILEICKGMGVEP